jgi:hypothetical protein
MREKNSIIRQERDAEPTRQTQRAPTSATSCDGRAVPWSRCVRGVYDRHEYDVEKKQAFEVLAAEIARIVDPQLRGVP